MPIAYLYGLVAVIALGVPTYAWKVRGRTYAIFAAVILSMSLPGVLIARSRFVAELPTAWSPWLDFVF